MRKEGGREGGKERKKEQTNERRKEFMKEKRKKGTNKRMNEGRKGDGDNKGHETVTQSVRTMSIPFHFLCPVLTWLHQEVESVGF